MSMVKNLLYPDEEFFKRLTHGLLTGKIEQPDGLFLTEVGLLRLQQASGIQVVVEDAATLEVFQHVPTLKFEELTWLAPSAEIYFETPGLPTLLVAALSANQFKKIGLNVATGHGGSPNDKHLYILMQERKDSKSEGYTLQAHYAPKDMEFLLSHAGDRDALINFHSEIFNEDPETAFLFGKMAAAVYKILSICNLYPPIKVNKNALRLGGKPGVKGRPARPIVKIRPHFSEKQASDSSVA